MKKLIYFDNAATSNFKPKCVIKSFINSIKKSANPGRSGHKLSIKNAYEIWNTRELISKHFGCIEPENVIFTKNCTEALNIVIFGTLKIGGNIIASCFEHNSVLRPLTELAKKEKITLTIIYPNNNNYITDTDVEKAINKNTYLVCVNSVSNVTGNKNEIEKIGLLCKQHNLLFLVDNAQGSGHIKINMNKSNINYLTFAGHKGFLSPQGIGGLCINSNKIPLPILYGGTGTESNNLYQPINLPERLESGTLASQNIISLKSGVKYVEKNFVKNKVKVEKLTKYLYENLKTIEKICFYCKPNFESGIISFNIKNCDSIEIANYLDEKYNIAVRGGLHCAPLTHKFLNTTNIGLIRISLNFKNTKKEINILIKALKEYKKTD